MRLTKSLEERRNQPQEWKRKFAFFPVELDDHSVIWLESYETSVEYWVKMGHRGFSTRKRAVKKIGTNSAGPGGPLASERGGINGIR